MSNNPVEKVDLHRQTASQMFDVPYGQVTEEQRRQAKERNFHEVYSSRQVFEDFFKAL